MNTQKLQTLTDRIYYLPADHQVDRPILALIAGEERSLIMDAGNSPAHARQLLEQLPDHLPRPEWLFLTHWHWDHILGLETMSLPAIAHKETRAFMEKLVGLEWTDEALDQRVLEGTEIAFCADYIKKELAGTDRSEIGIKLPSILFDQSVEVELGGLTCELLHVGGDHAADSSVLYVKEDKVLLLGDCLGPAIYDVPERHYTPAAFLELVDRIARFDARIYIESHHVPVEREAFWQELNEYREIAIATEKRQGDHEAIAADLRQTWGRELTEDILTGITYFCRGYRASRP